MPRWMHKLWALAFGYFWLPCPCCGREFGGHEMGRGVVRSWSDGKHRVACKRCDGTLHGTTTGDLRGVYEVHPWP